MNKVTRFFVYTIVGQVHELVLLLRVVLVLVSCKSRKTLLEHINSQRFKTRNQNINS